ncbi:MAG: T9SS type A sorting domain-containing protein [Bacteroidetes bacterium]|nr:T9SS type A sorting domain-containing protein [Bacteroidota bacterium]
MKSLTAFAFVLCLVLANNSQGQEWQKNIKDPNNFFSIHKAFTDYRLAKNEYDDEDGPDEIYARWAQFMEERTYPTGKPFNPEIIYIEWEKYLKTHNNNSRNKKNTWTFFGPTHSPSNQGGDGRINCLRFDPKDPTIMWAGSAAGGLWKTTDDGKNWTTTTDNIPALGVSDIAINPRNTDTMYIATGDGWGYSIGNTNYWGGTYSRGIMRSIDGGKTWDATGFTFAFTDARQITRILINPTNPDILIASTNNGIFKSKDAAATWTKVQDGLFYDMEFKPGSTDTIYATGKSSIYRSTDGGNNFSDVTPSGISGATAIAVAVTKANSKVVYAAAIISGYVYVYKSTDNGGSFTNIGYTNKTTFYRWYSLAFNVSPTDEKTLILGGINLLKSTDNGKYWSQISTSSASFMDAHADHRTIEFYPGSGSIFYTCNDGGIDKSKDGGKNYTNVSSGIQAMQFYRLGVSSKSQGLMWAGAQDNGLNMGRDTGWFKADIYADGMESAICPADDDIVLVSSQYGNLRKSIDGGQNFSTIAPSYGNWITPFVFGNQNPYRVYYGTSSLYISKDAGDNWKTKYPAVNGRIGVIAVAPANDSVIYVAGNADQYTVQTNASVSKDLGTTWTTITNGLPTGYAYLSYMAVERDEPGTAYATFSGFVNGKKVYMTTNYGKNWTNITGSLPNLPANCVAVEGSKKHGVYIGMDVGIYYRNDDMTDWVLYSDGLPNTLVYELEVSPLNNKIYAATLGRSIWQGDLHDGFVGIEITQELDRQTYVYPNPATTEFTLKVPSDYQLPTSINLLDVSGKKVLEIKAPTTTKIKISTADLPTGLYFINIKYKDREVVKKVEVGR